MIRHVVVFTVKEYVSQDAIDNAFRQLFKLRSSIPGILNMVGGKCDFFETKGASSFTHGFSIDFENMDAYDAFLNDPVTLPAKHCIVNITLNEFEGIFGFDIGRENMALPSPLDKKRIPRLQLLPPGSRR